MIKKLKKLFAVVCIFSIVLSSFTAIDNGIYASTKSTTVSKRTNKQIVLNRKKINLNKGKSYVLKAKVGKTSIANSKLIWKSSRKSVAVVNSKGKVTAKKAGTAKITCAIKDKSAKKAVCTVKVYKNYHINWVKKPYIEAKYIYNVSDVYTQAEVKSIAGGDWNKRALLVTNKYINETKNYLVDYNGNIIVDKSVGAAFHPVLYMFYIPGYYMGAGIDINGKETGDLVLGVGDDFATLNYWNTYDNSVISYNGHWERVVRKVDTTYMNDRQVIGVANYKGKYNIDINYVELNEVDKVTIYYKKYGKAIGEWDDAFVRDASDMAQVRKNGKWGYVNSDGKLVIKCKYKSSKPFHGNIAVVKNTNGKYGFINKKGKTVVPFIFENAGSVYKGKAWVKYNGKWGVIDITK